MEEIEKELQQKLETIQGQIAQLEAALQQTNDVAQQLIGGIKVIQRLKACTMTKEQKGES